jgi:hypothetical protein
MQFCENTATLMRGSEVYGLLSNIEQTATAESVSLG